MREEFEQLHDQGVSTLHHVLDAAARVQISETLVQTIGIATTVSFIWVLAWWLNRIASRPIPIGRSTVAKDRNADLREIRVKALLADGITEFVEDAVFKHKLTRDESRWAYNSIGRALAISDLIPKGNRSKLTKSKTLELKELIKLRSPAAANHKYVAQKQETNVVELPQKKVLGKNMLKR